MSDRDKDRGEDEQRGQPKGPPDDTSVLGVAVNTLVASLPGGFVIVLIVGVIRAVGTAVVPLMFGIFCGLISAGVYTWQLTDVDLGDFFGSAAQVGVGVLVALVLDSFRPGDSNALARTLHGGTVALTALGTAWALIGLLLSGNLITGFAFALTWGGLAAGMLGLLTFVGDPEHVNKLARPARRERAAAGGG